MLFILRITPQSVTRDVPSISSGGKREIESERKRKIGRKNERKRTGKSRREIRNANDRDRARSMYICVQLYVINTIEICIKPMYKREIERKIGYCSAENFAKESRDRPFVF